MTNYMIYKFNDFLIESNYINHISEKEFFDHLKNEFVLYPNADKIFRKVNTYNENIYKKRITNEYSDFNIVDPKTINRHSPNSKYNYINLLVSNLLSWKKYPKRNSSLICGDFNRSSRHFGSDYSNLYLVIPKKNSKIGLNGYDFWSNFEFGCLNDISVHISRLIDGKYQTSWTEFKKNINKISSKNIQNIIKKYIVTFSYDSNLSNIDNINVFFNPYNFEIQLTKWNDSFKFTKTPQECWTSSESLLIKYNKAVELKLID